MRREICLWVEWSWTEGRLLSDASRQDIEVWATALAQNFAKRSPRHFGSLKESTRHIADEIQRSLRTLSYGQTHPEKIHPLRRSYLHSYFNAHQTALPKIVSPLS